jgi:hypothetical protein
MWFSPGTKAATPTMANAASMHVPDLRAAFASVRPAVLDGLAAAAWSAAAK